jgi:hypothetical protein
LLVNIIYVQSKQNALFLIRIFFVLNGYFLVSFKLLSASDKQSNL